MPRVKRGVAAHKKHKKVLNRAEGYWGGKRKLYKSANEQVMKSLQYAYRDRRNRKRDMRRLWIARISAATRALGVRYSEFIHGLAEQGVAVDRKMLAHLAMHDTDAFTALVEKTRPAAVTA